MAGDHAIWSFCQECRKKHESALAEKEKECERLRELLGETASKIVDYIKQALEGK